MAGISTALDAKPQGIMRRVFDEGLKVLQLEADAAVAALNGS